MVKKRKAKPKVRETDPDEFEEDEEGWYEDPKEGEEVEPPTEPPPPDERPPNPLPPMPKVTVMWLGNPAVTERQSKFWNGIEFAANKAVSIDHLPPAQQQRMIKDAEGSKAWKVEIAEPVAEPESS